AAFSLGLAFNGAMLLLIRSFFSLQMTWRPTIVAVGTLVLNAILDLVLYQVGVGGIPLATSIVNVFGVVVLGWWLHRTVCSLEERRTLTTLGRVALAALVLAVVSYAVWYALDRMLGQALAAQVVSLGLGLAAGAAAYLGAAKLLGVEELRALASLRRRRSA